MEKTMPRTTAERSATAKAAYARRQADKALGIPSITAMAAGHFQEMAEIGCPVSKAEARRYAIHWIAVRRREAADRARWAVTVAAANDRREHDRAVAALAAELHADKPWRSMAEAREEAARRLEDAEGEDAASLGAAANASYWAKLKAVATSLSRR